MAARATKRAATTRLEPGQHSIDRAKPFKRAGRPGYTIHWYLRLHNGRLEREEGRFTQAQTKGEVRAKARELAKVLLKASGSDDWKSTSLVTDYMEKVTKPAIERKSLKPSTQKRYEIVYRLLRGECGVEGCRHKHSLRGLTVHDAMRPRNLIDCFEEIAKLHGATNAKQAHTVARKYLGAPLKVDEVIEINPLADLEFDLSDAKEPMYPRGGQSLTEDEYQRAIQWLLHDDPESVESPIRGRWKRDVRVTSRAACIDIILAQATTGLRSSELCQRPVRDCYLDDDGTFIFLLPAKSTKTKKSRKVPVFAPAVSERLAARLNTGSPYLFPTPSDPDKYWERRNRDKKLSAIYREMGEALGIQMFMEWERGHSWRTTNNTLLHDVLPEDVRIRLFGHTKAVNRQHYTAVTSTKAVVDSAKKVYGD
jgi:hypothetical protein